MVGGAVRGLHYGRSLAAAERATTDRSRSHGAVRPADDPRAGRDFRHGDEQTIVGGFTTARASAAEAE
jgi:hypothetical protein